MNNLFALNDTGVGLMSNSPVSFVENAMVENTVQVEALGGDLLGAMGGHAGAAPQTNANSQSHEGHTSDATTAPSQAGPSSSRVAVWSIGGRGNYWSDYAGYDADGDGVGDQAYRPEPGFAGALADNPALRLFQFTLAQEALDMAAKMFPVYRYDPVIEDSSPLMSAPGPALPSERGTNSGLLITSVLLLALAIAAVQFTLDIDAVGALLRGGRRAAGGMPGGAS
jgi:nitrous oxidase accessory protein